MQRLLVPTDFSPFAEEALRLAVALGRLRGAEIHLLHVTSPTPLPDDLSGKRDDDVRDALRQQAEATGTDGLTLAIRYAYAIAPEIGTYAEEIGADTIVIGTHGGRGLRRLMLGSVAEELVRTAPCDVLVAPPRSGPVSLRRLLVPVDLREGTVALLAHARSVRQSAGIEQVDLLHVLEPLPYPIGWLDEAILDIVPTIRERAHDALREAAEAAGLEDADLYVERGRPESVIERVVRALDSDLVLVAPHRQGRVTRALLGSVAGEVARTAGRPVLVARSLFGAVEPPSREATSEYTPSFR